MSAPALPPCRHCGGERQPDAPMYCTFCGAKQATGVANPAAYRTLPERYALVEREPGFTRARAERPRLSIVGELGRYAVEAVALVVVNLPFLAVARSSWFAVPQVFTWFAYAFAVGCGFVLLFELAQTILRLASRTVVDVFVITAESEHEQDSPLDPKHRVDLRAQDGRIRRVRAPGALLGSIVPGDIGVGYVQRNRLLGFRWFDVMPPPLRAGEPPRAPSCATCAAPVTLGSKATCSYCGAPLSEPDLGEHGARLAAVHGSQAAQASLASRPRGGLPSLIGPLFMIGVGLFTGYGVWRLRALVEVLYEWTPYALFAVVPSAILLLIGGIVLARRLDQRRGPTTRTVALLLRRRRTQTSEVDGEPRYDHFATIAAANGARRELRVMTPPAARDGSYGVAHVRGEWLIRFDAVEPDPA